MRAIIRWAVANSAAVNTLVIGVIALGIVSLFSLRRETFPEFELEIVLVSVPYPGADPDEVETAICQKIEEAVSALAGIIYTRDYGPTVFAIFNTRGSNVAYRKLQDTFLKEFIAELGGMPEINASSHRSNN